MKELNPNFKCMQTDSIRTKLFNCLTQHFYYRLRKKNILRVSILSYTNTRGRLEKREHAWGKTFSISFIK